jgi:hypothetical protein
MDSCLWPLSILGALSVLVFALRWWREFRLRMWSQWWRDEGSAAADREVDEWKRREGIR